MKKQILALSAVASIALVTGCAGGTKRRCCRVQKHFRCICNSYYCS